MIIVAVLLGFLFCVLGSIIFMRKADNNKLPTIFFSCFLVSYFLFIIGISLLLSAFVYFLSSLICS